MSLYSTIRLASNTLQANDIALQVVSQNIANVHTPGYIREEVVLTPAPTQRKGDLLLGLGVQVQAVVQKIDHFLEERLRNAVSDTADAETRESSYADLEGLIGELSDTDLSTSMNNFFSSVADILNRPEGISERNLAVLQGGRLTTDINNIAERIFDLRKDLNERVIDMAEDINRLIEEVRILNIRIATTEGGNTSESDAVGLRDQRFEALNSLAKLLDIRVHEQESGGVAVFCGGDYIVFEAVSRPVEVVLDSDRGLSAASINIAETDAPLDTASGELAGLIDARDQIMGDYLDDMDAFMQTLAFEFNKIYSSGQGLNGYRSLTSEFPVSSSDETTPAIDVALDAAGLAFTPVNGSFQLLVHNVDTGVAETTDVYVDLDGLGQDTTLASLAADLNAINGITATTTSSGTLTISADSADQQFAFANDTSGVLAALGLNTFFSGSSARDMGVNQVVQADASTFAASLGGIGADTNNAESLAGFPDFLIASANGASIEVLYDRMVAGATQASAISKAEAEGARVFEVSLRGQKMATSGVSLDEEAVKLMAFQRSFQAAARLISTLDELLGVLVSI